MLAVENIKALADSASLIKDGACDKSFCSPQPIYNYKHVHIFLIAVATKVIYDDVINHANRHAGCVYKL